MIMNYPGKQMTVELKIKDGEEVIAECSVTNHCIHDLEVSKKYRRKGYATRLIDVLKREFDAEWLWVKTDNHEAVALYNNIGFRIVEVYDGCYKMKLRNE